MPPRKGARPSMRAWLLPALAIGAFLVSILVAVFVPTLDKARDFRKSDSASGARAAADGFERLHWQDLVPRGWEAPLEMRRLQQSRWPIADSDPDAKVALRRMREFLDAAPAEPSLAGRSVRIPGYVVPLEGLRQGATEFLLVPSFGACIHTPPPPANQVIHVVLSRPMKDLRPMAAVWVRGTLGVERRDSGVAASSYRLDFAEARAYEPAPPE